MANEFKVKKGLIVNGSGSTILDIQGSQGQLFSVTDNLSGSLFAVNDISGIPIMEVFSDDTVKLGTFGSEALIVTGSKAFLPNLTDTTNTNLKALIEGTNGEIQRRLITTFSGNYTDLTNKPTLFSGNYGDLSGKPSLSAVALSGEYSDLLNKPTLFSGNYTDLTNKPDLSALNDTVVEPNTTSFPSTGNGDKVYIAEDTGYMYRWNGTGYTQLTDQTAIWGQVSGTLSNQGDLQTALDSKANTTDIFSGVYSDLTGKPTLFSGNYADLSGKPSLSTVATSGNYGDLINKPTLFSGNYNDLSNLPTLFSGNYSDLSGKPSLSTVATSGQYSDLLNKPTLFSGNYSDLSNKPSLSTVATSGNYTDLTNKPTLFSGNYNDLSNKPNLSAYVDKTNNQTIGGVKTFTSNLTVDASGANLARIKLNVGNVGSPQIELDDNGGDQYWAVGADDADNSFKIQGSTSSMPTINNGGNTWFEIRTNGVLYNSNNRIYTTAYHPEADKWTNARTLTLSGDLSGNVSIDGSSNVSLSATVNGYVSTSGDTMTGRLAQSNISDSTWAHSITTATGNGNTSGFWINSDGTPDLRLRGLDSAVRVVLNSNGSNSYVQTNGGNFGIGSTSPSNKLHVNSTDDNNYSARFQGNTTNSAGVWTGIGIGGESNNTKSAIIFEDEGSAYSRGKLHLAVNNDYNHNDATKADARLTVDSNGNIGIGTTSPNYKLEVNGTIKGNGSQITNVSAASLNGTYSANLTRDFTFTGLDNNNERVMVAFGGNYLAINYDNDFPNGTQVWGDLKADKFVDRGNTSYYLDPASTSNLNTVNFNSIEASNASSRNKIRLYPSSTYAIGMQSANNYGHLSDWAMTFQFSEQSSRGFWWGHNNYSTSQGAMSLTTDGRLTVAKSLSIGEGTNQTSPSSATLRVQGNGDIDHLRLGENRSVNNNNPYYYKIGTFNLPSQYNNGQAIVEYLGRHGGNHTVHVNIERGSTQVDYIRTFFVHGELYAEKYYLYRTSTNVAELWLKTTQAYEAFQISVRNHSNNFTTDISTGQTSAPASEASWSADTYHFNGGSLGIGTGPNDKLEVNGNIRANAFVDRNDTTYYIDASGQSRMNTLTLRGNRLGFIDNNFDAEIRVGDTNPNGTGATFDFWGDGVQYNAQVTAEIFDSTSQCRANIFYDRNNTSYFFHGDSTSDSIRVAGDIVAKYSDERLKDIEKNIPNALEKVGKLNGFYYTANKIAQKFGYSDKREIGLSAQEVEAVLPELIKDAPIGNGYKTVDYSRVVPLLVEAIKEQQQTINSQEERLKKLETQIQNLIK